MTRSSLLSDVAQSKAALREAKKKCRDEKTIADARSALLASKKRLRDCIVDAIGDDALEYEEAIETESVPASSLLVPDSHPVAVASLVGTQQKNSDRLAPCEKTTETQPTSTSKSKTSLRVRRSDGLFPCFEWSASGTCKHGDTCKFSHLPPDADAAADVPSMSLSEARKRRRAKTLPCFDFIDGSCSRGSQCRYKHMSDEAGKDTVEYKVAKILSSRGTQEDMLAKVMEIPLEQRPKARAIFFAKQRTGGPAFARKKKKKKASATPVCYAFQSGSCDRGDRCKFSHGV
eukprot:g828.t1